MDVGLKAGVPVGFGGICKTVSGEGSWERGVSEDSKIGVGVTCGASLQAEKVRKKTKMMLPKCCLGFFTIHLSKFF